MRDEQLIEVIREVHADRTKGRGVAGYRKMWRLLRRDGRQVPQCTVERLMRGAGLRGIVRGRTWKTTVADPAAGTPGGLVNREVHRGQTEPAVGDRRHPAARRRPMSSVPARRRRSSTPLSALVTSAL